MATVSIILPTYNRQRFLKGAFEAICAQTFTDWELIVVDDGSTDDTQAVVEAFASQRPGQVRYIYQANGGVSAARNRGLDEAKGPYLAFFDSDDLWLPHHLTDLYNALQANAQVHWVFGAGRHLDMLTGKVLKEDSFRPDGKPRPFLSLVYQTSGPLKIITDERALQTTISNNQASGLQASMFRRDVFASYRFPDARIGEDFALAVHYLASGQLQGYLDQVHVVYRVHDDQTSTAAGDRIALDKRIERQRAYLQVMLDLLALPTLKQTDRLALRRRCVDELYWKLGYHLQWNHGLASAGLGSMRQALRLNLANKRLWRSYLRFEWLRLTGQAPKAA